MRVLEVFADVSCAFTHVGLRRIVERRAELGRDDLVLWVRAWPLEMVNGVPLNPENVAKQVTALRMHVAPELFAGFDPASYPGSSVPALALAADAYGVDDHVGERVSLALRDALFEHGRDIGDDEVLRAIAADNGLELSKAGSVEAVVADWEEGKRRGVRGSPEYFVNGRGYFCPALDITKLEGQLIITPDREAFEAFLAECFAR